MEIGMARGLAVDLQYNQRMQDARYQDQQMKRAQAENEASLKAFEDDTDYMNAANSFDHNIIKAKADNTIRQMGAIIRDNPDYRYNPDVRRKLKELKVELKSNNDVIRGMASDEAFKNLNKDLAEVAKNPQMHNTKAYQELALQKQNYIKYGHQDGEEGLKRDGGAQAFVYTKPRDYVNINQLFSDVGNDFKDMKQESIKGGGRGAYQEYANPVTLDIVANQMYSQNKTQIDEEALNARMNPIDYVKKGIDAHIKKQRQLGDFGLQDALTLRALTHKDKLDEAKAKGGGANTSTTWETEILKKENGIENGDVFDKVFGTQQTYNVVGSDGKPIEMSGYETKHTGKHRYMETVGSDGKKQTQKFVEVYTDIPESVSKEKGFTRDPWGFGDNEVDDKYTGQVSKYVKEGKDGKNIDITRVKTWIPIDVNNQSFRGRYNQMNMANKFQQAPNEDNSQRQVEYDSDGNIFDAETKEFLGKQY